MSHRHVAVWIDHAEAKIFHVTPETFDVVFVHAPAAHVHRHPTTTAERDRSGDDTKCYHEVARGLADAEEILVVGPSTGKLRSKELRGRARQNGSGAGREHTQGFVFSGELL